MQSYKYDKAKYKIVLFGVLEDGRRMSVVINDIEPYFEAKIPDDISDEKERGIYCEKLYNELNMGPDDYGSFIKKTGGTETAAPYWKIEPTRYEIVTGKPFMLFQEHISYYVRIYFNKTKHRKDAIEYVRAGGLETTHDDKSCYYRVVSRDSLVSFGGFERIYNPICRNERLYKR
jgi:hypothetical protein